jgi:hypothetical protein
MACFAPKTRANCVTALPTDPPRHKRRRTSRGSRRERRHRRRQRFRVPCHAGLGSTDIYSCSAPGPRGLLSKLRAPICFNPVASRTVLPLQELRGRLGMEGKTPDQIAEAVQAAYARGELPKTEMVALAYMFSADQVLGPGVGHWHPHMTVYTRYYENSMLGGNQPGVLPIVGTMLEPRSP